MESMNRAVFFDKDGTLIEDVPYNVNPSLIKLKEGAGAALNQLRQADFELFVVSNQSGVARGYFAESELAAVWEKLSDLTGVQFADFYHCPHLPDGEVAAYSFVCDCRKPQPGLLLRAAFEHHIDLKNSWFVGDTLSDVEAGNRAGCRTILVADKDFQSNLTAGRQKPFGIAPSLWHAARIILETK